MSAAARDIDRSILAEVLAERERQDARFGEQNHPDGTGSERDAFRAHLARGMYTLKARRGRLTWADVLREEFYEAVSETDPTRLRAELIQVAAVSVAWIAAIDRRMGVTS